MMKMPEYISKSEVQRVCQELNLSDWTQLTEPRIAWEEAKIIQAEVGKEALMISTEEFKKGLEVETGMIVLAHLKEMLTYYLRLDIAEFQGDLLKAFLSDDPEKMKRKYKQYLLAAAELSEHERSAIEKLS